MSQNLKIFLISTGVVILLGLSLFLIFKPRKIISPVPEKPDIVVLFSPPKEKITPTSSLFVFSSQTPVPKNSPPSESTPTLTLRPSPTPNPKEGPSPTPTETPIVILTPTET